MRHPNEGERPMPPRQDPNTRDRGSAHPHCNRHEQAAKASAEAFVKHNPGGLAMEPAPRMTTAYISGNPASLPA